MSKFSGNDAKFTEVRALCLPLGHYAITSSGPLGVRGLRAIGDIDIVVDDELWDGLAARHPVTQEKKFSRIQLGNYVEIFGKDSYLAPRFSRPTVYEQIITADIIDDLPFVRLEYVLHFKKTILLRDAARTKQAQDLRDIQIIEELLAAPMATRRLVPVMG